MGYMKREGKTEEMQIENEKGAEEMGWGKKKNGGLMKPWWRKDIGRINN